MWQYTAADGREAYVNAIRADLRVAVHCHYYQLADLIPEVRHAVAIAGEVVLEATGAELMHIGLEQ